MSKTIYGFVFRYSARQQVLLLLVTLAAFPFLYLSLELPKTIINRAINGQDFPAELLGMEFDQIPYLVLLCGIFLLLVLINGAFKFTINVWKGRLGERMLRRLRYELYSRVLRFPLPHFKRVSQGEIIPMITSEVEPLGGFIGDAVAQPVFQGGQLLTIFAFILVQDPFLGLAAISLYPLQGYLIPKLQRRVNDLAKQRVRTVRRLSDRLGESISGIAEIRAHDASNFHRAGFADLLGRIYEIRFEIYQRKFFIKFLNNFLAQLTPFFFYLIGGYLVIRGDLSFGALVAVLAAYKDMSAPWKELLLFYQQKEDARIKYEQVIEQFEPPGLLDERLQLEEPEAVTPFDPSGEVSFVNVSYVEDGATLLEGVSFTFGLSERVAIVGPGGGGKEAVAMILARLLQPTSGRVMVAGEDLFQLPEAVTGRRMAYVGQGAQLFAASIRDNILLGLKHRPLRPPADERGERAARAAEAALAGNTADDILADWVDYAAAGVEDSQGMSRRLVELLHAFDLDREVYELGLRGVIDPAANPALAERLLQARCELRERLSHPDMAGLVEPFDAERYNENATLAENLLFGSPVGPEFEIDNLAGSDYVRAVLEKVGIRDRLLEAGSEIAEVMVELFGDLDPDQEIFERYSFVGAEDLSELQAILARLNRLSIAELEEHERARLLALPFKMIPARHRLGVIDDALKERILEARRVFAADLPPHLRGSIEFFDAGRYSAAASIQDNILFGKVVHGTAQGPARVGELIAEVVDALGLREDIIVVGLDSNAGIGGGRLSAGQRQKIALVRCVLKRPDIMIVDQATATLDNGARNRILDSLFAETEGRCLVWVLDQPSQAQRFDRVLVMQDGRLVEQGTYAELEQTGAALRGLVAAE